MKVQSRFRSFAVPNLGHERDGSDDMSAPEAAAAARPDESSNSQNGEPVEQTVSPSAPITETEVGEYREQDRVLPVSRPLSPLRRAILTSAAMLSPRLDVSSRPSHFNVPVDLTVSRLQCKHRENNEECGPRHIQNLQRGEGCRPGVCVRIH